MRDPLGKIPPEMILRHIHDGLLILDPEGRVLYTNEVFETMLGRGADELRGLHIRDFLPASTCEKLDPSKFASCGEAPSVHFNLQLEGPDGSSGSYCFTAFPVTDEAGALVGVLQNFRGMDKLRHMILQLEEVNQVIRHEKERTQQIVDSIGDGVFTVDTERRILSFSRRMEEITGISAERAVGRFCMDVLRGSKCVDDCPLTWSLEKGEPVDGCRERLLLEGGRRAPVEINTTFLRDEEGTLVGLTAVLEDLSELERLRTELREQNSWQNVIGRSPAMRAVFQQMETVAGTDATLLITGESGTGKEVVARAVHYASPRKNGPFVAVNCAALSETLLESELFGHVRGAFTGAVRDKPGRFELAAGGTILLDEIGDTSPALQAKLLRVLQERSFERVGDTKTRSVDVRIIAATNKELRQEVQTGAFREDLYFRLAVVPIELPPLRERRDDIPLLVDHFVQKVLPKYYAGDIDRFEGVSKRALAVLMDYDWPGNVRELEHAIEFAMISTPTDRIERAYLPGPIQAHAGLSGDGGPVEEDGGPVVGSGVDPETERLRRALERNRWNVTRSARDLGISRTTLWRRMKKHGLADGAGGESS